jgi:hypothetical protein
MAECEEEVAEPRASLGETNLGLGKACSLLLFYFLVIGCLSLFSLEQLVRSYGQKTQ